MGVLRGDAAAVRAAARRATSEVATYFQVQVAPGGLPGATSPFVLTPGDAYERVLAAELVSADEDLTALASRLDTDGTAGRVVMTALRDGVPAGPALPAGAPGSEGTLGYLIASAAPGGDVARQYGEVRDLRARGGSWGVVAAIVEAEVGRVGAALGALLDPGTVPVLAGGPIDLTQVLQPSGGGAPQRPGAPAGPGQPGAQPQPSPGGGGGGPAPSPVPSPTAGPADPVTGPVTDLVEEVVDTVLDLVSPSPFPVVQVPVKVPVVQPSPVATLQVQVPTVQVPGVRLPPLLR